MRSSSERKPAIARGFSQRLDIDFHDMFAPVARLNSLKTFMAASVEQGMQILQIDIATTRPI